jgi:hypothetical protein
MNIWLVYGLHDGGITVPLSAEAEIAVSSTAFVSALSFLLTLSLLSSATDVPYSGAVTSI